MNPHGVCCLDNRLADRLQWHVLAVRIGLLHFHDLTDTVEAVTCPILPLSDCIPAAFFKYHVTDDDFTVNSNVLSLNAVIVTTIGVSGLYLCVPPSEPWIYAVIVTAIGVSGLYFCVLPSELWISAVIVTSIDVSDLYFNVPH
ncbi:hypothetical protein ACLB2K_065786 [Fragaria x ananassa]